MSNKTCRYFAQGRGRCPFGANCFYKHADPEGQAEEPQRRGSGAASGPCGQHVEPEQVGEDRMHFQSSKKSLSRFGWPICCFSVFFHWERMSSPSQRTSGTCFIWGWKAISSCIRSIMSWHVVWCAEALSSLLPVSVSRHICHVQQLSKPFL